MDENILDALEIVAEQAVMYVGMANYREREEYALKVLARAFNAAKKGNLAKVKWVDDDSN